MAVLGAAVARCAPAAPAVSGADFAIIEGSAISCASAQDCLAIGSLDPAGEATPVADAWNGKQWRLLAVRLPAGTSGGLDDVSCKAGSCLTVGSYIPDADGFSQVLAVTWNGRTLKTAPAALNGAVREGLLDRGLTPRALLPADRSGLCHLQRPA